MAIPILTEDKHKGITSKQLHRYIKHLSVALENEGFIEFKVNGVDGAFKIIKREFKTKSNELVIEISSGNHPREILASTAEALKHKNIEHQLSLTPKQQLPKRLKVAVQAKDQFVQSATIHVINEICEALNIPQNKRIFTLSCWGPLSQAILPKMVKY